MPYTIQYTDSGMKRKERHPIRNLLSCAGICLLSRGAVHILGWDELWLRFWIPGDVAITTAAFDEMLITIQDGHSIYRAFLDFCRVILSHG